MTLFTSQWARFLLAICVFGISVWAPSAWAQDDPRPLADKADRYGDPLPAGAVARLGTLRWRPADHVAALDISPDGKTLASAGIREVCLWELATGKKTARFLGDREPFLLAFGANGKTLVSSGSHGHKTRSWDLTTGNHELL